MELPSETLNIASSRINEFAGEILHIDKLQSLYSNEVYYIKGKIREVIVKTSNIKIRGNSTENEYKTINKLNQLMTDIPVPKVFCFVRRVDTFLFIEEFIKANSLKDVFSQNCITNRIQIVQEIAFVLKKIHSVQIQGVESLVLLDEQLKVAEENLIQNKIDLDEFVNIESPMQVLSWLKENKPANINACLLHGDFRPKNILYDSEKIVGIIDWEHSFQGDSYYDFAILFYYLSDEEKEIFIRNYGISSFEQGKLMYYDYLSKFLNV